MATTMNVKCKNCGNSFPLFWHSFNADEDLKCPHCSNVLPTQYVQKYVQPAFAAVWEANYKIRSKHESDICDWFEFDFEEIYVPNEKFKN